MKIRTSFFHLQRTLESAQSFHWRADGDSFLVVDRDVVLRLRQSGENLHCDGADEPRVRRLLGLDSDHDAALALFRADPHVAPLLDRYGGLRVMRTDPWTCLVSFVCSACSNVPRITGNVRGIAKLLGEPLDDGEHAFPAPRALSARALRDVRLGFREKYVTSLFGSVREEWLASLSRLPFPEACAALEELPGVGTKVAECVMAFSLGFGEACPVDVWIRRVGRRLLMRNQKVADRRIAEAFRRRYGPHTALAQQILFAAARDGELKLDTRRKQRGLATAHDFVARSQRRVARTSQSGVVGRPPEPSTSQRRMRSMRKGGDRVLRSSARGKQCGP